MDPAELYAYQQYLEGERQRERESRSLKSPEPADVCMQTLKSIDKQDADRAWRVAERETQERIRADQRWSDRYEKAVLTAYIAVGVGFAAGLAVGWFLYSK